MLLGVVHVKLPRVSYGLASERSWSADWEVPETDDIGKQVFGGGGHRGSQANPARVAAVGGKMVQPPGSAGTNSWCVLMTHCGIAPGHRLWFLKPV